MGFFNQFMDEVHDRNIDNEPLQTEVSKDPSEPEVQDTSDVDTEYPEHPDYIALRPNLTEHQLWKMPAIRFYSTIICFGIGMVTFGIVNAIFNLGLNVGAVGWYQILGGAVGFIVSREVLEPRMKIPFSAGTPEQKKAAADAYVKEMRALDDHIQELRNMRGASDTEK